MNQRRLVDGQLSAGLRNCVNPQRPQQPRSVALPQAPAWMQRLVATGLLFFLAKGVLWVAAAMWMVRG